MKKSIKFAVSLFICGLMLLSGCANASTSLPKNLIGQKGNYPKSVNIIVPDFFKPTGAANVEEAKQQWLDNMSQRYGTNFHFFKSYYEVLMSNSSSASSKATNSNGETVREVFGLNLIKSSFDLKYGIVKGLYMPLEKYLANNPTWNALPEEFKSRFEVDGHIYAIPTSVSKTQLMARIFRDEALQKAGITVTDLKSFRDFVTAYKTKTGSPVGSSYMSELTDILNAYGLYPSNDQNLPFNYDPSKDCYVDWLTKDTAVQALEYLRELNKTKSLHYADSAEALKLFNYGSAASNYDPYYDYDNCTEVLTLNPEYPQVLITEMSGFAMYSNTPQPQETVNLMVDMLFGSEQNYLECRLGSSENYILNSDGTITIKMAQDSAGNAVSPCMPNFAGNLPEIFPYSDASIISGQSGDGSTDQNTEAKNNARLKMISDSLQNGSLVEIPPEYQMIKSAAFDAQIGAVANLYYVCISDITRKSDKTVQQIVDEYKAAMLALGGNTMLDEMNAAIGKKTAYYYG